MGLIYAMYDIRTPEKIQYVGQTTGPLEKRLRAHRHASKYENHSDWGNVKSQWIREIGESNLRAVPLEEDPPDGLDAAEMRWIKQLGTMYPGGVNTSEGGYYGRGLPEEENPACKLTREQVVEVIDRLEQPGVTSRSLAAEYGVTKTLILKIDHGDLWPDVPRPRGLNRLNRNRRMTLTEQDVREIRREFDLGEKVAYIARRRGLNWHIVGNVVKRKTWKDVV